MKIKWDFSYKMYVLDCDCLEGYNFFKKIGLKNTYLKNIFY
jgi:hypothetical protein